MKSKEKIVIAILVAITIIAIIVTIIVKSSNKKEEVKTENVEESFSTVLEDGTILNMSDKLHETKKFEGMEISNIQLTETEEETLLIATVTNTSETKQGGYPVKVKMLDKQGNEVKTIDAYIGELQPGKSVKISTSATYDVKNIHDFIITK